MKPDREMRHAGLDGADGIVTTEKIQELVAYFRDQPDVVLVYLFGSQASRRAHPGSDLDVAVLLDEQERSPFELMERRKEVFDIG